MIRTLITLCCLCALPCGCKKKDRSGTSEPDNPGGALQPAEPKPGVPARPALPSGWVELRQPEGVFAVYLPGPAQPIKAGKGMSLRQPVPPGRMLMADYGANKADPGLYCEVGVSIYSPELVDGVKAAEEKRGPILPGQKKRTAITWCGYPAFEDSAEDPETHHVAVQRRVWIGNRHYYCSLYGREVGRPTPEERAAAFDSFTPEK